MPFPGFHACRMRDPADFDQDSFRITKKSDVQIVIGTLKNTKTTAAQSVRYPIGDYTADEAARLCKQRGGIRFEPARAREESDQDMAGLIAARDCSFEFNSPALKISEHEISERDTLYLLNGGKIKLATSVVDVVDDKTSDKSLAVSSVKNVTILRAGKWRDMTGRKIDVTFADLDEMVENARKYNEIVKPVLKLSHLKLGEHLKVMGAPALGFLRNFRRVGDRLVVDFERVPKKIAQLFRAGTFFRISAEFFDRSQPFITATGKRIRNLVTAAGMLGADVPAVENIDDILKLFSMNEQEWNAVTTAAARSVPELDAAVALCITEQGGEREMQEDDVKKLVDDAVATALSTFKDKVDGEVTQLKSRLGEKDKTIDELKAELSTKTDAVEQFARAEHDRRVTALIDKYKKQGRLTPAQEPQVKEMLVGNLDEQVQFVQDGKQVTGTRYERVEAFLASLPKQINLTGESGEHVDEDDLAALAKVGANVGVPQDVARYIRENLDSDDSISGVNDASQKLNNAAIALARKDDITFVEALVAIEQSEAGSTLKYD